MTALINRSSILSSPTSIDAQLNRSLEVTHLTDPSQAWHQSTEWSDLLIKSGLNTPFQTPEWHQSWWAAFGDGQQLSFLSLRENGDLIGLAPFLQSGLSIAGISWKELSFLGSRVGSDYCDFIYDKQKPYALDGMLSWLTDNPQEWSMIQLSKFRGDTDSLDRVIDFFTANGYPCDVREQYDAPTRLLNNPIEDAKLPKKKSLKRHANYFKREGTLVFQNLTRYEEIEPYLEHFFNLHIQRWGETDTPSQFLDKRQKFFYREMVRRASRAGWLLFSVLTFNEQPIAYHLGFEFDKTITWYKPVYSPSYSKHSPGEVLLKYLLEYALEEGMEEFDFTIGSEAYKYRYSNLERKTYDVRIYQNQLCQRIDRCRLAGIDLVKRNELLKRIATSFLT